MKNWLHKHWEAWLIRFAARILLDRNVARSPVVSRRDNNQMFEMAYTLKGIEARIRDEYESI